MKGLQSSFYEQISIVALRLPGFSYSTEENVQLNTNRRLKNSKITSLIIDPVTPLFNDLQEIILTAQHCGITFLTEGQVLDVSQLSKLSYDLSIFKYNLYKNNKREVS